MKNSLSLFEAMQWIGVSRGRRRDDVDQNTADLIEMLSSGQLTARGCSVKSVDPEEIPLTKWHYTRYEDAAAHSNGYVRFHALSYIDSSQEGGFGGALTLAGEALPAWYDIKVQTRELEDILSNVPDDRKGMRPTSGSAIQAHKSSVSDSFVGEGSLSSSSSIPAKQAASPKQIREAVEASVVFFTQNGLLLWTKDEAEKELRNLIGARRTQIRKIFAGVAMQQYFPGEKGRRGTPNSNRSNELEQFRQYFNSANMRN